MKASLMAKPALWLVLSMLAAGSMAYYVVEFWSANQPPGFSDLYAPWWGAHELLLHGRNPYSPAVAHEIQTVIYGAPVAPSPDDPSGIGGGFAYPPYAALLLGPTVYLPFPVAQKIFLFMSVLVTALSVGLWLRAARMRLTFAQWFIILLFVFGSFPVLQAIKLQNLSLIAAFFLALSVFFVTADRLVLAGIFLAASTFKPQFTIALIPWLLLWIGSDWRRRRSMAWSFLATMLVLISVSQWLAPGWTRDFLHVVRAYRHYTYGHSLLDVWLSPTVGSIASVVILFAALGLCWRHRSETADSPRFFLATSLALAANVVVIPTLAPHAQLLLLPGILCFLPTFATGPTTSSFARVLQKAFWMLLAWPWIAAFGLLLASILLPVATLLRFWQVPLYTSPLLPLAVLFALGCIRLANPAPGDQDSGNRLSLR